ncbi:unnamed protein product [Cuscuta epithymum]|uniref:DYW domain-containing protein n=1 Tax=Cuscuta epithymum TaxID=186058 RepID=A0AAV0DUL5_9ASTE|nr:unnamed protein product [Cuscuta epithymum]
MATVLHPVSNTLPPTATTITSKSMAYKEVESCSTMAELNEVHAQTIKLGLSSDNNAMGRVIKFCAISESGDLNYALKVFDTLPEPDTFIYNTIIRGYLKRGLPKRAIVFYSQMLMTSVWPNSFTFPPLIRCCCLTNMTGEGKQIHGHVIKFGFGSDGFSQNNLIHMYGNFNCLEEASKVFDGLPCKDDVACTTLISGYAQWGHIDEASSVFESIPEKKKNSICWNAMISAYVKNDRFHEAFALFERMRAEGVPVDKFVAASILSACGGLGALKQGEWIVEHINKSNINVVDDSKLANKIIDMYCKCGCLGKAFNFFNVLPRKGISSWNCMIGGFAVHGRGKEAIDLFKEMERKGLVPDDVTFVNVLSACSHSGLIEEGKFYFDYMNTTYKIEPRVEHYGCLVDMFGRAGLLNEASRVIEQMPYMSSPNVGVMGALLGACKIHNDIDLGEQFGRTVIELDPHNSGRYILLANLYANAGRWEDVAEVRKLMNDRGVKKSPGYSMIEVEGGVVDEFIAGGITHPQAQEIYAKVNEMLNRIRSEGYVPDETDGVLLGISEEEEMGNLITNYHSEKLAIGFGLLKTKPGEIIRITKNLRVCRDCHRVSKLVSKLYDREIIVRDRNRFHHFKGGECSCNDYW